MPPRVGSALDHLAAAIVALAVFALPISFIFLATGHHENWFVVSLSLATVLALAALIRLVSSHGGRARTGETLALIVGASAVTWIVGFMAAALGYGLIINSGVCGSGRADAIALIGGVVVYGAVGGWSLSGDGPRFIVGPSVGVVLGVASMLITLAANPASHGYCYT